MPDVVKMIENRRQEIGMSYEDYARHIGLKHSSILYKYIKRAGDREMSMPNFRKIIGFYHRDGDEEMVNALLSYATGDVVLSLPK